MRPRWRVLPVAVVLLLLVLVLPLPAARAADGDTAIADSGEFRDMVVDAARGRLYVTDATSAGTQGVAVFNLATHARLATIPLYEPAGLDLSPDGGHLAVAAMDGLVVLVDLSTLAVESQMPFTEGMASAMGWDVAFIDSSRVIVTLGQYYGSIGGYHQALVVNFTSARGEGWFGPSPWAFTAFAEVHADVPRHLAYVVDAFAGTPTTYVYGLSSGLPTLVRSKGDSNFTSHSALSTDGRTLYFTTGKVYDAASLAFQQDLLETGEVDPGIAGTFVYFAAAPHVDKVRASDRARVARFSFRGQPLGANSLYGRLRALAVDEPRGTAYVVSDPYYQGRTLRAVPLTNALLDPIPWDGAVLRESPPSISAVVSGNVSAGGLQMAVDGHAVVPAFDPEWSLLGYVPPPSLPEGPHHVVVSGPDAIGTPLRLEWNFSLDSKDPEILLDSVPAVTRTPQLDLTGHILDANLRGAWVGDQNLTVDPQDGSFHVVVGLREGGNVIGVRAEDVVRHGNITSVSVLYVPPTTRFVHARSAFSIEFPSAWAASQDVVVLDARVDLLVNASAAGGTAANFNVIGVDPQSDSWETGLLSVANQVLANLSSLPGVLTSDEPRLVALPGLNAVTYAWTHNVDSGNGSVHLYQRQYLVATPDGQRGWVLTFTTAFSSMGQYDPLFEWVAGTMRAETTVPGAPVWLFLVLGCGAAAAAVGAGLFLLLRRRRAPVVGPQPSLGPTLGRGSVSPPSPPVPEVQPPENPPNPPR